MPPYNFSSDSFQDFCKINDLTDKQGFEIILNRITELNKQLEGGNDIS